MRQAGKSGAGNVSDSDHRAREGDDLSRRIATAKARQNGGAPSGMGRAETRGWAIGIEFVGAVLVGGFIGWAIDHWSGWHTAPFGMIVMLGFGFAAGVRRALQTSAQFDSDQGNDPVA